MSSFKQQLCDALDAKMKGRNADVPEGGEPLISAFLDMSRARSWSSIGPNPISWSDLAAWSQVMQVPIQPHHADIIKALDYVWMADAARRQGNAPEGVKTLPPISDHPISAALLDVMMG